MPFVFSEESTSLAYFSSTSDTDALTNLSMFMAHLRSIRKNWRCIPTLPNSVKSPVISIMCINLQYSLLHIESFLLVPLLREIDRTCHFRGDAHLLILGAWVSGCCCVSNCRDWIRKSYCSLSWGLRACIRFIAELTQSHWEWRRLWLLHETLSRWLIRR